MKVQVKYFANIKDLMGKDTEDIKDMNSITVGELWLNLTKDMDIQIKVLYAVNQVYVSKDYKLNDGDEIAFFTPVTGGLI